MKNWGFRNYKWYIIYEILRCLPHIQLPIYCYHFTEFTAEMIWKFTEFSQIPSLTNSLKADQRTWHVAGLPPTNSKSLPILLCHGGRAPADVLNYKLFLRLRLCAHLLLALSLIQWSSGANFPLVSLDVMPSAQFWQNESVCACVYTHINSRRLS